MSVGQDLCTAALSQLKDQLGQVILGKPEVIDNLLIALLSGGHALMEDVPGVGKTTLAKALAKSISGDFKRVQFTPDLLPTDILGSSIYNPRDGSFTFKESPVFTNILLADEINRASPRTQSSLLEAMSEGQASIDGTTHPLPTPFLVIATQNPIEFHGTYPLPEAQLDRFGMMIHLGYPAAQQEVDILYSQLNHHPVEDVEPVVDRRTIIQLQDTVRELQVDRKIARYIVSLAEATRHHTALKVGASPRGSSKAPLEHLMALPADGVSPEVQRACQDLIECFYRARFRGDVVSAEEMKYLGSSMEHVMQRQSR